MPKPFDNCVTKGGKVRTKTLSKGKYKRVCTIGGKTYEGYIRTKKKKGR